ncbi:hypothetical protein [Alkalibacillus almallahensis]|uniref:hypothetical protein n=1 Tax=Alkalibacillus almallahensis TaxID=1379154 RepID=UPI0014207171|nr:hypothetical protein [Alkalibacillus almallahensis]NIK13003.1 hypothetical protein [Alkalibacillus almallahensis]
MKHYKYLIPFISMLLMLIAGCSNGIEIEGDKILVQKRVGEENKYEYFKEITEKETVQTAKDILESASWENKEVSMAYPPHYKFSFEGNNEQSELIYHLWISPNKDMVELVIEGGKYVQLGKSESEKLFKTITEIHLSEVE